MTLQELSQHYKLREQLIQVEDILAALRRAAAPGAQVLTGMPRSNDVYDKVGNLAIEIADMERRTAELKEQIAEEEKRIGAWIDSIDGDQIRMIFRLRFIRCLTWAQVADVIGGGNTEDSVKKMSYRYLDLEG